MNKCILNADIKFSLSWIYYAPKDLRKMKIDLIVSVGDSVNFVGEANGAILVRWATTYGISY